jgi:uncharacterized membrane protein YhaH (DUF805 family)
VAEAQECYYLDGARNQQGPVAVAEITRLVRNGTIRRDTLVWYAGMPDWRPASQVSEFASLFMQPPAAPRPASPPAFAAGPAMQRTASNVGSYLGQAQQVLSPQFDSGKGMGFGAAVTTCFRKYVHFTGRARRPEYWYWILFQFLVLIGLSIVDAVIIATVGRFAVFATLGMLALLLPSIAVGVRRLHDQDYSGFLILIGLIPLIGWVIILVLMCLPGTPGPNRFGPNPTDVVAAEAFD